MVQREEDEEGEHYFVPKQKLTSYFTQMMQMKVSDFLNKPGVEHKLSNEEIVEESPEKEEKEAAEEEELGEEE